MAENVILDKISKCVNSIRKRTSFVPDVALILGSGLGDYASNIKIECEIPYSEIDTYGVVSQEIAAQMASHAKNLLNVDYCVSFTGNAGPTAMENKKVGEVYIGIAFYDKVQVYSYLLDGDRKNIQEKAINIAYELLAKIIEENN